MEILLLIVGLAIGFATAWFIAKFKFSANSGYTIEQMDEKNAELIALNNKLARKETENQYLQEKINNSKDELEEKQRIMHTEFTNLANSLLEEKSKKFIELNEEKVSSILNPLREKIKEFEEKVDKNYLEETRERTSLKDELKRVIELNQQVSEDANRLSSALKGDKKLQGDWGETQLEMILQKAGLENGIHYTKQKSLRNENNDLLRPDFIINLPESKNLIIDSKVSLIAYENYYNTEDEDKQAKFLKDHILALHKHINELSAKNYSQLYGINSPDFVLLFVSLEPALSVALKEDISIYEKALDKNIVLVSGSTLLATLRTISYIWKQENQKNNVVEIARQSGMLYDKFVGFIDDMLKIGRILDDSKKSYSDAMGKLVDSPKKGDTIIGRMEQIKKLGANASKSIPQNLLDRVE